MFGAIQKLKPYQSAYVALELPMMHQWLLGPWRHHVKSEVALQETPLLDGPIQITTDRATVLDRYIPIAIDHNLNDRCVFCAPHDYPERL